MPLVPGTALRCAPGSAGAHRALADVPRDVPGEAKRHLARAEAAGSLSWALDFSVRAVCMPDCARHRPTLRAGLSRAHRARADAPRDVPGEAKRHLARAEVAARRPGRLPSASVLRAGRLCQAPPFAPRRAQPSTPTLTLTSVWLLPTPSAVSSRHVGRSNSRPDPRTRRRQQRRQTRRGPRARKSRALYGSRALTAALSPTWPSPCCRGARRSWPSQGVTRRRSRAWAWEVRKLRIGPVVSVAAKHAGIPDALVDQPERAGVDRRLQLLAATHVAGEACVVVSCGTALTVDIGGRSGCAPRGIHRSGLGPRRTHARLRNGSTAADRPRGACLHAGS